MKTIRVGGDTVYQDADGVVMVTCKAEGWIQFPEGELPRSRARAYLKAIKMAKSKCGLNKLSSVAGIAVDGKNVRIAGNPRQVPVPNSEQDIVSMAKDSQPA